MKLILTRHGETVENRAGILQGHMPSMLTEQGLEQARKVARRLEDESIDSIYSSDLARASDTAAEIHRHHAQVPLVITRELRERDMGKLQGVHKDDPAAKEEERRRTMESNDRLFARADGMLRNVLSRHADETVLFVCHNGIGRMLVSAITGQGPEGMSRVPMLHNTSLSVFDMDADGHAVTRIFNDIGHLGAEPDSALPRIPSRINEGNPWTATADYA